MHIETAELYKILPKTRSVQKGAPQLLMKRVESRMYRVGRDALVKIRN